MSNYTLVVVDMQPFFKAASYPEVVVGVTQEILAARSLRRPVIFLEYIGCEPTHYSLTGLLKGYALKARTRKDQDDGYREVESVLRRRGFGNDVFRVCGVNANYCVRSTAEGLAISFQSSKIHVVRRACGTDSESWDGWPSDYCRYKNMRLV